MRHVIYSSTDDTRYCFYMPVVARMWRALGYVPHAFVVEGTWRGAAEVALEETAKIGEVHRLKQIDGYRDSTIAQVSRVLAASVSTILDDEIVMTSDVDMLPLSNEFFSQQGPGITVFFSNAYPQVPVPHYPMCYLSAPKHVWQDMTGADSCSNCLAKRILDDLGPMASRSAAWNFDELWISRRLAAHPWFARAKLIARETDRQSMVVRRIDRAREVNPDACNADDMHAHRSDMWRDSEAAYWKVIREAFWHVCGEQSAWLENYREEFTKG